MVLVDSCVWIHANSPKGDLLVKVALEALLEEYEAAWCGPVKLEVLGAARKEKRKALSFFFDVVPYLVGDDSVWEEAKELSWRIRDAGHSLPWNDLLIAVLARRHQCRVYTLDAHFDLLQRHAGVLLYRPGYNGSYNSN